MVSGFRTSPDFSCSFVTFTTRWLLILPINNWEQIPLVVNLMDVCLDGLLCYAGISRLIGRKAFPSQCLSFAHKCLKFVLIFPWGQCRFPEWIPAISLQVPRLDWQLSLDLSHYTEGEILTTWNIQKGRFITLGVGLQGRKQWQNKCLDASQESILQGNNT